MKFLIVFVFASITTESLSQTVIIDGALQIGESTQPPEPGTIRWNGLSFEGWDGSEWLPLTSILSVSESGDTLYNGINWVIVPGISQANYVVDGSGNVYETVEVGTQTWMNSNLKTIHYNDGSAIPLITDPTLWLAAHNNSQPGYTYINNDPGVYGEPYGPLYNWFALSTSTNGNKNVCPTGWHVPTDTDFSTLTTFLGGINGGGAMKETGTAHWCPPNSSATNTTGLTCIGAGQRLPDGSFFGHLSFGYYWSSSSTPSNGKLIYLNCFNGLVQNDSAPKGSGLSVKCVKD